MGKKVYVKEFEALKIEKVKPNLTLKEHKPQPKRPRTDH